MLQPTSACGQVGPAALRRCDQGLWRCAFSASQPSGVPAPAEGGVAWPMRMTAHYVWTTSALELGRPSACPRLCTCLRSSRASVGDQCPQGTRIVNQDILAIAVGWEPPS